MNTKRYVISSLVGFLFIFLFEWILHGVLLKPIYEATQDLWRGEEDCVFLALFVGQLFFAFILCRVFVANYESRGIGEGIRFGVLMGFLFMPHQIIMYAVAPYPLNLTLFWIVGAFVEMIVLGVIFAVVYRKSEEAE